MRIAITLSSDQPIKLPIAHNHIIQGFIYGQLEANLARWLHGDAYSHAKRTYRMFTFSRLQGRYVLEPHHKTITFTPPVALQLASVNTEVLASFAEHLLKSSYVTLGKAQLSVTSVEILKPPPYQTSVHVKTLSPITIYSTFSKPDGKKLTHYYAPYEADWSVMLLANLARKASALKLPEPSSDDLHDSTITALRRSPKDKKVVRYKQLFIEAYDGLFELSLPEPYFELAYDTGLGSKNAQGFGMVTVV
jgi:CRISPR-associated endoribonuclease Cas6